MFEVYVGHNKEKVQPFWRILQPCQRLEADVAINIFLVCEKFNNYIQTNLHLGNTYYHPFPQEEGNI